ncbi:iron-containing alcohol dehydrogenase [uncultured Brachyspira sp.]|uniref:iron-containing alcohol dehydrogenase n=1 Tax=uncultured Brachyspira sp. TaxID=221953 RepID=UPI00261F9242|nr:iron-containing alcohol dehydrogenase [uncultured Brachyspira sp.]
MQSFIFNCPTKVIFGKDTEINTAKEIKNYNGKRVFIVYGSKSVKESGLLEKVENIIKSENIEYELFGGVRANPTLSYTKEGVKKAIDFKADFILAVGGGSVIDSAKAIAHGAANPDTDIWDFWTGIKKVEKSLPIGCILTISAAGSETSMSAVLTNEETLDKRGLATDFNRPKFAIMNPCLTFTLPYYQVACGIADMLMHTFDRYFGDSEGSANGDNNQTTDAIAEAVLRTIFKNGLIAMKDKNNYDAMSELMWCGSLSHNTITGLGLNFDFIVHKFGHELSAKFDVAHGASLSAMWGSWAKYCFKDKKERFIQYSKNVWNIDDDDTGIKAIEKTIEYFKQINMPTNFTELGIGVQSEEVLQDLTRRCIKDGKLEFKHFRALSKEDVYNIFKMSNV